jgi:hypothetical protein
VNIDHSVHVQVGNTAWQLAHCASVMLDMCGALAGGSAAGRAGRPSRAACAVHTIDAAPTGRAGRSLAGSKDQDGDEALQMHGVPLLTTRATRAHHSSRLGAQSLRTPARRAHVLRRFCVVETGPCPRAF